MKRCKTCGQSMSSEDRISELPEALLLQILSLLPTKDVVAMSVLAKRWKSLWKMVPNLEFDYNGTNDLERFSDNVSRCFLLQRLHLEMTFESGSSMDIGILMGIAFGLKLRELRLSITVEYEEEVYSVFVITAPLKYLKIKGIHDAEYCLIENTPELVEASIIDVSHIVFENIIGSLTSVKRLSLQIADPLEIKFPIGSIFYQLVFLELHAYEPEWWNLLMLMLDSSPNLQVLKLIGEWFRNRDRVAYKKWNQPIYVPQCLLLHLKTLVWKNYEGEIEDEKEVAKYILRNAKSFEKCKFLQNIHSSQKETQVVGGIGKCGHGFEFMPTSVERS